MKKYDVNFILPMPTNNIVGGYKIVYEYANYLAYKGLKVCITYNGEHGKNSRNIPDWTVYLLREFMVKFGPKWFRLYKKVNQKLIPEFDEKYIDDAHIIIATTAVSSIFVSKLKPSKGIKFYFVQDYENWEITDDTLIKTYGEDFKIITVAKWLKEIVQQYARYPVIYIPNGIDSSVFKLTIPFQKRYNHSITMLYHHDKRKGCDIGLNVINRLKYKYPDLNVHLFGSPDPDKNRPSWITYVQNASPKQVCNEMNRSRFFLCTSRIEGFGLTGLESLFSGCCLITTDCKGPMEYADEENAYICKADNEDDMYRVICNAFEDETNAMRKVKKSQDLIKNFDLRRSRKKFYQVIMNTLQSNLKVKL